MTTAPPSRARPGARRLLSRAAAAAVSLTAAGGAAAQAPAPLRLTAPLDYQVQQRTAPAGALLPVVGAWPSGARPGDQLELRLTDPDKPGSWTHSAVFAPDAPTFHVTLPAPAGGWRRLEARVRRGAVETAVGAVDHVGVGEVFVVAGQSNAANHGEERQATRTGMVAAFSGAQWTLARDPQPGAGGDGGSFMPAFGDALAERLAVPVGIIACAVGATSVREWMPEGVVFPNPPTLTGNVRKADDGAWESTGALYSRFIRRLRQPGPHGFRAVLWHQGESDAHQADPTRTLAGPLYAQLLRELIARTRRDAGWTLPWFVAQASYHTPEDPGSAEIRAAQASLWKSGDAFEGPDTDALTGALRDGGGAGVHFSGPGLREHGARWAAKVLPWLEAEIRSSPRVPPNPSP